MVERFADIAAVIRDADVADKAEIYRGLNLVLTYEPGATWILMPSPLRTLASASGN
jgi:hypothetical protein